MDLNKLIYKCDKCNARWPYGIDKKDHVCKKSIPNNYRIYRVDPKNIAIQRKQGNEWRTISYHGNNINSLISGLFELIAAQHTPEAENISEALVALQLELVSGIEKVEKMIEEYNNE